MNDSNLQSQILDLIDLRSEGTYWDYKKNWPANKAALLHDIICMANNIESRDAYLIIGVDEENDFELVDITEDKERKNANELVTFLRDEPFQGGMRPSVSVRTMAIVGKSIDVIVINNTRHTPYVLTSDFPDGSKTLRANNVYTRVGDTNTPIDKTADLDKIEYLWKKRFAINETAMERLEQYLDNPSDWEYDDKKAVFFHKTFPEFTIQIANTYYDDRDNYDERSEFYCKLFPNASGYHWEDFEIKYHQTALYTWVAVYLGGSNYLIALPEHNLITRNNISAGNGNWFRLYYYRMDNIVGKVNSIFVTHYSGHRCSHSNGPLTDSVLIFPDGEEHKLFCEYIVDNKKNGNFPDLMFFDEFEKSIDETKSREKQMETWERETMNELNKIYHGCYRTSFA
jgi:hypothetical protein